MAYKPKLRIGGIPPRFSPNGPVRCPVTRGLTGIWLFNKQPGLSDSEARARGIRNRAPGAVNTENSQWFPEGVPTMATDYWRFAYSTPLQTIIPETDEMAIFVVMRSNDPAIGNTVPDNVFIAGTYGNGLTWGFGLEIASTTVIRASAYQDNGGSPGIVTNSITITDGTIAEWRIVKAVVTDTTLDAKSFWTPDGANSTPTTLVGGHKKGTQLLTIGGRIGDEGVNEYTGYADIAMVYTYGVAPTGSEDTQIVDHLVEQMKLTGLTYTL